jgi:hypothetical protein
MKKWVYLLLLLSPPSITAQIGKVGINTTSPAAMLHVKDSSVLFSAGTNLPFPPGLPPVSGPGVRMMWYPDKAAFRGGRAMGQEWNKDSIGLHSFAYGYDVSALEDFGIAIGSNSRATQNFSIAIGVTLESTGLQSVAIGALNTSSAHSSTAIGNSNVASGIGSLALGNTTTASGYSSTSLGQSTTASGSHSVAMHQGTTASGTRSLALGVSTMATGTNSIAAGTTTKAENNNSSSFGLNSKASGLISFTHGSSTIAKSTLSTVFGAYNDSTALSSSIWVNEDPLFIVGNGSGNSDRRNALTILKNGNTGIGIHNPQKLLHLRSGASGISPADNSLLVIESNTNAAINLITQSTASSGIHFGNPSHAARAGIVFNSSSPHGLSFRTNGNVSKMVITDIGDVGIGTDTPQRRLHVRTGSADMTAHSSSVGVFEANGNASITLMTPSANESGVFFGNPISNVHGGIVYNANVPNGLAFRTGGNSTKMAITETGDIGIGTTAPQKRLHVSTGTSGGSPNTNALAVIESNGNAAINLLTPNANESGIYFGNAAHAVHGGILYNAVVPNGLAFRTNGNTTRMVIDDAGNVGIGDLTPNAKLHVKSNTGGGAYHSNAKLILEDNVHTYLQFSTLNDQEGGILSGQSGMSIRSGIIFESDSSVLIRAGGNTTRLTIDKSGNTNTSGEIRRPSTGPANMVPICYGTVDAAGAILNGTDNFTVAHPSAGLYEVTITGENYTNSGYTTNVTAINSNPRIISIVASANNLIVRSWNGAVLTDSGFHFVIYKE